MPDPIMGIDALISDQYLSGSWSHPNPAYDYTTAFLPRKLKDYFRWSEYLFTSSAQVFAAIQKYGAFAVNDIKFTPIKEETSNDVIERYEEIFKNIKAQAKLIAISINTMIYGNCFINILPSISRHLKCSNCGGKFKINKVKYRFNPNGKTSLFTMTCPKCGVAGPAEVLDLYESGKPKPFNILLLDPKFVDIEYNKFTDEEDIYMTIDGDTAARIRAGDRSLIETVDMGIIQAALDNKNFMFKFNPMFIKHIKLTSLAGLEQQWGYPFLVSALKSFLHAAVLKKANEAIAYDYLIPLRVVFPESAGMINPSQLMNLELWKNEFIKSVKQWRRDPLHIEIAPVPIGRVQVGGEGRGLLAFQEVQIAEENILAATGMPKEIVYGSIQWKAAPISLRLLQKQLEPLIAQLNEVVQWWADTVAYLEKLPKIKAEMIPFKLYDDTDQKVMLLQSMATPQPGALISAKTMGELLGVDYDEEQEQLYREVIEAKRKEMKLNAELSKIVQEATMQQQQQQQSVGGQIMSSTEESIMQEAQSYVEQLATLQPSDRKRYLTEIKKTRPVLHAVIVEMLNDYRQDLEYQGRKTLNPNA